MIINCKEVAAKWKQECSAVNATLAIIQVGNNPASNSYIKGKLKDCEEIGYNGLHYHLDENIEEKEILGLIEELNNDSQVNGIIVQLPLPKHLNEDKIAKAIAPIKDVDGFIYDSPFTQCTPLGVSNLLDEIGYDVSGKFVVVLGRSENVGRTAANLLLNKNATVVICHSKTPKELRDSLLQKADVVVSAVGCAGLFSWENVKPGCLVIDVGINRNVEGKLCGDFIPPEDINYLDYTSVPGGIGLLTRAMLMKNTYQAYLLQNK